MFRTKSIPFFLFLFFLSTITFSQKEGNTWYFGRNAGIDFNSAPVSILTNGQTNSREGVCAISDRNTGLPLFYSEGTTVWNRNHVVMPNGNGLLGDYSSTQSSIAIPNPTNSNRYYLFTTAWFKGLRYSEIDMTLAAGNGDVIPATKNTPLLPDNESSEKLIAVKHCNDRDYWVVSHRMFSNAFVVYLVNAAGVQPAVVQNIGAALADPNNWTGAGYLKFSVDGSRLAHCIGPAFSGQLSNVELLNFDNSTGIISGPVVQLTGLNFPYGAEFSLQKKYLYISETLGQRVNQYDLNAANVNASKIVIASSPTLNYGALQMGPDGRIYVAAENGFDIGHPFLGTINTPEGAGTACGFVANSVNLSPRASLIGLPTFSANFLLPDTAIINYADRCAGEAGVFSFTNVTHVNSVQWDFGDASGVSTQLSPSHTYAAPGTYNVQLILYKNCGRNDTVVKPVTALDAPLLATLVDTAICYGGSVQLTTTGAQTYSWSPATGLSNPSIASPVATPLITTEYIVTGVNSNGCTAKDTVNVLLHAVPVTTVSNDTIICANTTVQLNATGGAGYLWSPAATLSDPAISNPVASPTTDTKYYVTITDANTCSYPDSVMVMVIPPPVFAVDGPGQVCESDTVQLVASGGDIYSWQPAGSISNAAIANPLVFPAATTTYMVTITESLCNESATLSKEIVVFPLPQINAVKSNDLDCSNDRSQLNATGGVSYVWSPAASLDRPLTSNPIARPAVTMQYMVRGADVNGCINYDTLTVNVGTGGTGLYLMPTGFTPNNDGLNDCYGVKYWGVVEKIEFSIYNRWGERVFYSDSPGDCWNGVYKGKPQDSGVFVYMIRASAICDKSIFRKGTFTLIR